MNPFKWLGRRKARRLASGPIGEQGRFYYLMSYEDEYQPLASSLPSDYKAILFAELFLFRFWLTQCAYRLCKPDALDEKEMLDGVIQNGLTLGKAMFERLNSISIEDTLHCSLPALLDDRFKTYDAVFSSGRTASDPLALEAVSRELAAEIYDHPPDYVIPYLREKAHEQLSAIISAWSGEIVDGNGQPTQKPDSVTTDDVATNHETLMVDDGDVETFKDEKGVRSNPLQEKFGQYIAGGTAKRDDPIVITETREYVAIEHAIAKSILGSWEYSLEQQRLHEIDGRVIDELVYAVKPMGAPEWTHTSRLYFDVTAGFNSL